MFGAAFLPIVSLSTVKTVLLTVNTSSCYLTQMNPVQREVVRLEIVSNSIPVVFNSPLQTNCCAVITQRTTGHYSLFSP